MFVKDLIQAGFKVLRLYHFNFQIPTAWRLNSKKFFIIKVIKFSNKTLRVYSGDSLNLFNLFKKHNKHN